MLRTFGLALRDCFSAFAISASTRAICFVIARLRARSTRIPSRSVPVPATIWARPLAASGSSPAITSGRPALSSRTIASIASGSTPWAAAAVSISSRQRAVRRALATIPPGLFS